MPKQYFQSEAQQALIFVFQEYLSKPMTDVDQSRDFYLDSQAIAHPYHKGVIPEFEEGAVYRVNHGNAHNVRVTSRVRDVVMLYADPTINKNPRTRQLFSGFLKNKGIQKLEIVASFYVACRESEIGWSDSKERHEEYRRNSAEAFAKYAKSIQKNDEALFSDAEIEFYRNILVDPYFQSTFIGTLWATVKCVLSTAHGLDLARCFDPGKLSGMEIFLPSLEKDEISEKRRKLFFVKSEIQLILTGSSAVSTFDMTSGKYINKRILERNHLFMRASLDSDIAMRLVSLSDVIRSVPEAEALADALEEAASQSVDSFLNCLDRVERASTLRDPEVKAEEKFFRYEDRKRLLEQGPLPKSVYTVALERIFERILTAPENIQIEKINDQVLIIFKDTQAVYNLSEILLHANFDHIQLDESLLKKYIDYVAGNLELRESFSGAFSRTLFEESELSMAELFAIYYYTEGASASDQDKKAYRLINGLLRSPEKINTDKIAEGILHAVVLASALKKLPHAQAEKTTFRYIEDYGVGFKELADGQDTYFSTGFTSTTEKCSSKNKPVIKTEENIDTEMQIEGVMKPSIAAFSALEAEAEVLLRPLQLQVVDYRPAVADEYAGVKLRIVSDLGAYSDKSMLPYTETDAFHYLNEGWLLPFINGVESDDLSLKMVCRDVFDFHEALIKEQLLDDAYKVFFIEVSEAVLRYQNGDCTIKEVEDKANLLATKIEYEIAKNPAAVKSYFNIAVKKGDLVAAEKIYGSVSGSVKLDFFEAIKIATIAKNFAMIDFLFLKAFKNVNEFSNFLKDNIKLFDEEKATFFMSKISLLLKTMSDFEFVVNLPLPQQEKVMGAVDSDIIWAGILGQQNSSFRSRRTLEMMCGELIKRGDMWAHIEDQAMLDYISTLLNPDQLSLLVDTKPPGSRLSQSTVSVAFNSQAFFSTLSSNPDEGIQSSNAVGDDDCHFLKKQK